MIVSFDIDKMEDLELLLQLTKRLGIKQVGFDIEQSIDKKAVLDTTNEVNDEINDIFGSDNKDIFF